MFDIGPNDLGRTRDYNGYILKATDPFGHWHIKPQKGSLPGCLTGSYTTADEAQKSIDAYLNSKAVN